MKFIFCIGLIFAYGVTNYSIAQHQVDSLERDTKIVDSLERNTKIYVEGFGLGGYYSVNYERVLFKKHQQLRARIGASYWFNDVDINRFTPVFAELNYAFYDKGKIELLSGLGAGAWFKHQKNQKSEIWTKFISLKVATNYRWKKLFTGVNIYLVTTFATYTLWGGVSFGMLIY